MNRRKFLQNSSVIGFPFLLNGLGVKTLGPENIFSSLIQGSAESNENVLVLIQLFGGNDGLNTVIPLDIYSKYYNARSNIAINEKKILSLEGNKNAGLHPVLKGFQGLFNDGKMAIVQSVGYPNPSLSHFSSTDVWMSGSDSNRIQTSGWAGRYLNNIFSGYPNGYPSSAMPDPPAIQIGPVASLIFRGIFSSTSLNITKAENVYNLNAGFPDPVQGRAGRELNFIRQLAQQTQVYTKVVKKAADLVTKQADYPDTSLAKQLKTVAGLIKGGLKTKMYMVSFDGFDTHAEQANANDSSTGRHADLLKILDDAVSAFQNDLEFLGIDNRVMTMTFSEFGRRVASNDSMGTDHGTAAPMFVFGTKVKNGIIGNSPDIPEKVTNDYNIPMQIDFRTVYSTMLQDWMKVSKPQLLQMLFKDYGTIPVIRK